MLFLKIEYALSENCFIDNYIVVAKTITQFLMYLSECISNQTFRKISKRV